MIFVFSTNWASTASFRLRLMRREALEQTFKYENSVWCQLSIFKSLYFRTEQIGQGRFVFAGHVFGIYGAVGSRQHHKHRVQVNSRLRDPVHNELFVYLKKGHFFICLKVCVCVC